MVHPAPGYRRHPPSGCAARRGPTKWASSWPTERPGAGRAADASAMLAVTMSAPEPRPLREQRSLFGEILDWMLAPLLLLWPMSVVLTWLVAQGIANKPFDRELGEMVRVLAKEVSVRADVGRPQAGVTLPG